MLQTLIVHCALVWWVPSLAPWPARCQAPHRTPSSSKKHSEFGWTMVPGCPASRATSSVTTVPETSAPHSGTNRTTAHCEPHWLSFALLWKGSHMVNANMKCSMRVIPPADHHHREEQIKYRKSWHMFPFLATLRSSH